MLFDYCWFCAVVVNSIIYLYNVLVEQIAFVDKFNMNYCSQGKADDQLNWRVTRNEKLTRLREKLRRSRENLEQGF